MNPIWDWLDVLAERISVHPSAKTAVFISIAIIGWGNGVVLCSRWVLRRRGKSASELLTLVAHSAAATGVFLVSRAVGFTASDLGIALPRFDRPHCLLLGILGVVALGVLALTVIGVVRHRAGRDLAWNVEATRLLVGTAGGEEFLFRGSLLALWAGTGEGNSALIAANVVTFGLWHVAGARKEGRLRWGEVLVPGVGAFVFVAARLAFDSLLLPWLLHAGMNLPKLALDLGKDRRGGRSGTESPP